MIDLPPHKKNSNIFCNYIYFLKLKEMECVKFQPTPSDATSTSKGGRMIFYFFANLIYVIKNFRYFSEKIRYFKIMYF